MAGPEKLFENKIKKHLDSVGAYYIKYFANRMTKSGIPDILACVNGYFLGIEVKAERGKPSKLQKYHRSKIRESGGISIILYPDQFEDFKLLINDLIHRPELIDWEQQKLFDKE